VHRYFLIECGFERTIPDVASRIDPTVPVRRDAQARHDRLTLQDDAAAGQSAKAETGPARSLAGTDRRTLRTLP
jgi:hypothetical protein